jgi:hypothetical protein
VIFIAVVCFSTHCPKTPEIRHNKEIDRKSVWNANFLMDRALKGQVNLSHSF